MAEQPNYTSRFLRGQHEISMLFYEMLKPRSRECEFSHDCFTTAEWLVRNKFVEDHTKLGHIITMDGVLFIAYLNSKPDQMNLAEQILGFIQGMRVY